ncbi:type IV pilus assembly protein PilP [Pseudoduganella lurida]|uniref:Type IV pilus assembly protein PilP n=1 Tax=Pseudoduganella lurida TaxID=1036180 RepID=A0A562QVH2_9BURK|nr:pilus assembly protein PilP [Pseudoduganella lurida]TWI60779.1 type IV pilus assembly protein PilP [Pseudoduganella lurida]
MKSLSAAALCCVLFLSGCGDRDEQEVRQWMKEVDATTRVAVKPLSEPKTFVPFAYASAGQPDPFNPNKLLSEGERARPGTGLAPDTGRRKEFLEGFPLDTMKMVGTLQKGSAIFALLQIDRAVYQVRAGQRLGQNYGRITAVTDSAVNVTETVQDASGEWVERAAKLELQESKENTQ